jgi:hypothetical protein
MKRHRVSRFASVAMAAALLVGQVAVASATVWTDDTDYAPGSTVTISGDNTNGAGYVSGETVHVDVSGPNGYTSSCDGVADENGAWSCEVTLWASDLAVGDYDYTATGLTSGTTESGSFTDQVAFALDGASLTWYDASDAAAGFNIQVSGTYRCDSSSPAANNCSSATVAIGIYPSDGSNNSAAGSTVATKALTLGTAVAGTPWSWTFEFRPVPGAGQWDIPADGKFDVKASFTFSPGSNGSTANNKYNDDAFGVDSTLPTSTIDTPPSGNMPTADGTATDPGSTTPTEHFSGFDNSDSPKPMHVEIRTNPGDVLVAGSGLDLGLANLGPHKQSGDWAYDYADTGNDPLADGGYCMVARATDHAGNVQDPVTTECFTVGTAIVTYDVSGMKFQDLVPLGQKDSDPGLEDWDIWAFVDTNGDGSLDATEAGAGPLLATFTAADGTYSFTLTAGGDYVICENKYSPTLGTWYQSFPAANTKCAAYGAAAPTGYSFLDLGADQTDVDFGNWELVFTGFYDPVGESNLVKAGQGVPFKWNAYVNEVSLDNEITDTTGWTVNSATLVCAGLGESDVLPYADDAGQSGLRYDWFDVPTETQHGQFVFAWKTLKAWANSCRTFQILYNGQIVGTAGFYFTR